MAMTAWLEARLALTGLLRLVRGDRGGLGCFDRSVDGFWRSFRAAIACYPLYLVLLTMRVAAADWQHSGGLRIATVETIAYILSWTAFPLLMLSLTRRIGRADRFFDFMVPYNWYQLPQSALFVVVGCCRRAAPRARPHPRRSGSPPPLRCSGSSGTWPASPSTRPVRRRPSSSSWISHSGR